MPKAFLCSKRKREHEEEGGCYGKNILLIFFIDNFILKDTGKRWLFHS